MPRVTVVQPSPSVGLERAVDDYLSSCRARGLSPRTMTAYSNPLLHVFLPWCAEQGIVEVGQLDQRALDRFTARLLDVGGAKGALSKFSVAAYVRPVRQLLVWARKEGEAVAGQPQLPRLPRRVLDVLSREEIARLEEAAVAERDQLIIRVLADTGMRVGELVGLGADAFVRQGRDAYLRVQGKGERERLVPVAPSLVRRIERHLRSRRKDTYSDRLFLALRRGRDGVYAALTVSGVEQLVRVAAENAGLDVKRVHPHALRHAYVTHALRGGMNPMLVAQVVGHSSLRMIEQVYSHLTVSDAHAAMMRLLTQEK
jgi:integrase/recombinase XerD